MLQPSFLAWCYNDDKIGTQNVLQNMVRFIKMADITSHKLQASMFTINILSFFLNTENLQVKVIVIKYYTKKS